MAVNNNPHCEQPADKWCIRNRQIHTSGQMVQAVSTPRSMTQSEKRLLDIIRQKSFLKGQFKLASGAISDYYLDMKPTSFDPEGASLIGEIICRMLADDRDAKAIGG